MSPRAAAAAAGLLALAACAHRPPAELPAPAPPPGAPAVTSPMVQEGLASFYARSLAGRPTASGERYDPAALTCAHRSLPFGTRLLVTELESGRSVVVTVNDRGPTVRGRVLDLSLAAARKLDMVRRGVVRVRLEVVRPGG